MKPSLRSSLTSLSHCTKSSRRCNNCVKQRPMVARPTKTSKPGVAWMMMCVIEIATQSSTAGILLNSESLEHPDSDMMSMRSRWELLLLLNWSCETSSLRDSWRNSTPALIPMKYLNLPSPPQAGTPLQKICTRTRLPMASTNLTCFVGASTSLPSGTACARKSKKPLRSSTSRSSKKSVPLPVARRKSNPANFGDSLMMCIEPSILTTASHMASSNCDTIASAWVICCTSTVIRASRIDMRSRIQTTSKAKATM
mmetsp:Transcript_62477/g.202546  ORF Transcript_62477/g.202546 Transcript_62477/m.202546 type:complete len:255 (-) Transcript_62477:1479-2243(-)